MDIDSRDGRLSWSITLVVTSGWAVLAVFVIVLTGVRDKIDILAILLGGIIPAFCFNLVRPRYALASRRWKRVYDWLLKQFPMPD
jgi:hypothetical protein